MIDPAFEPPPKSLVETEHDRLCREFYRSVPEWLNHKGKPCKCKSIKTTIAEHDLPSNGYAWMVQCKKCKSRWVNHIEG